MSVFFRVVVALPGLLFLGMGLRWGFDPAGAGAAVGMPLLDGIALSSQIGDTGSFFTVCGILILAGVVTQVSAYFTGAGLLMACVAVFRVVAYLFHDAALTVDFIAVEVVVATLLFYAASKADG